MTLGDDKKNYTLVLPVFFSFFKQNQVWLKICQIINNKILDLYNKFFPRDYFETPVLNEKLTNGKYNLLHKVLEKYNTVVMIIFQTFERTCEICPGS